MLDYQWNADGSLTLTVSEKKTVHGESVDDWRRVRIGQGDLGRLRHVLAVGPPARAQISEASEDKIAGEEKWKIAGEHQRGSGV